jgi:hypothetical protein
MKFVVNELVAAQVHQNTIIHMALFPASAEEQVGPMSSAHHRRSYRMI